ncbi:SRPBCC family protein [Rhodococcus sp. NPDC019627]|uniref:SRPBCC family protein n=1 Tax=unclassified Rhodococcus (in: high G+C Gram-positive bacteria) TaxID=192944 RepID=UPI0033FFC509
MTRWYPLAAADDEFLQTARFRIVHVVYLSTDPAHVWSVLTAHDALVSWSRLITASDWTSHRPFGIGTTRTVTLGHGAAALRERFYRWEEGRRITFTAESASRPGIRRFAEDISLDAHPDGTRLTWTFAVEAAPGLTPFLALSLPLLRRVTRGWARGLAHKALDHPKGATR